jgi:hypothetical protein
LTHVSQPVSVERDAFNIPTITGGSFEEMWETFGYECARDRLWQNFLLIKIFSGQFASLIGPGGLASDIEIRRENPSTQECVDQFNDLLSEVTQIQLTSNLRGLNRYIIDVNNGDEPTPAQFSALGIFPIPNIDLGEYLLGLHGLIPQFSGQENEYFNQLFFFSDLTNLVQLDGKSVTEGLEILSDIFSMKKRRGFGIIAETTDYGVLGDCHTKSKKTSTTPMKKVLNSNKSEKHNVKRNSVKTTAAEVLQNSKNIRNQYREAGFLPKDPLASYSMAFPPKSTFNKKPMGNFSIQTGLRDLPGVLWECRVINKTLGIDWSGLGYPPYPLLDFGVQENFGYAFTTNAQVGTLPGVPALLQNPEEDIYLRTDIIQVSGGDPVTLDVFVSPYNGYVTRQNFTSPLFDGTKSLVKRKLSIGHELSWLNPQIMLRYSASFEEFKATLRGPQWTESINLFISGHDNYCNVWGAQRGGWFDFGAAGASDLIPQGILGNPIPSSDSVPLNAGYLIKNPKTPYIVNWNTPFTQTEPSVIGDAEINRVSYLSNMIEETLTKGKISIENNIDYFSTIGFAAQTADRPETLTGQNYEADTFGELFQSRFEQAVAVYPTLLRQEAVEFLQGYNGRFVDGDKLDLINSVDVSDQWMLAQQWQFYAHEAIFQPTFGAAWTSWPTSFKTGTTGYLYNRNMISLMSRLLQTSTVQNPVAYPDWLSSLGDINLLIVESLDKALDFLNTTAGFPLDNLGGWGEGRRARTIYSASFLGPFDFPDQNALSANRAGCYIATTVGSEHTTTAQSVNQIGNSALIKDGAPVDVAMSQSWTRFTPVRTDFHKGCM